MAVQGNKTNPTSQAQDQAAWNQGGFQQQASSSVPPAPQPSAAGNWSFLNPAGAAPDILRTQQGAVLKSLSEMWRKIAEKTALESDYQIKVFPFDHNTNTVLSISAVTATMFRKNNPGLVVFRTVLLEGSIDGITQRTENWQGQQFDDLRVAGDAWNPAMMEAVGERLRQDFPNAELISADVVVLPKSFDVTDEQALENCIKRQNLLLSTKLLTIDPNWPDLNLVGAQHDASLQVRSVFNNPTDVVSSVGELKRADIQLDLVASPIANQQQQQSIQTSAERQVLVERVSGYMDFLYDPVAPNQQMPQQQWGPAPTQLYAARFVITDISAQTLSLNMILLGILQALALGEGNAWYRAFTPRAGQVSGAVDRRDIGAIGFDMPKDPVRIKTQSVEFLAKEFNPMMAAFFRAGMGLAIDVPETGEDTVLYRVMAAAAEPDGQSANMRLIESAQTLTNGNFAEFYPNANEPIITFDGTRIHLGTFIDPQDENRRRDIRHIDYLTVLNYMGDKQMPTVAEFSNSYRAIGGVPASIQLAKRKKIIDALTNYTAEYTGFARRYNINPKFLQALAAGAAKAGLSVRNAIHNDYFGSDRMAAGYSQFLNTGHAGVFNAGNFGGGMGNGLRGFGNQVGTGYRW